MTTQSRLISLDEFLELPDTEPYTELVNGELCQKPVGKNKHSTAQTNLILLLSRHPGTQRGRPRTELGFRFPNTPRGNLRVPDVSYYLPGYVPDQEADYPDRAPDLVAEVRSKGQSAALLRERLAFLRLQGAPCTLLVDPDARTVEVHDGDHHWQAGGDDEVTLTQLNRFTFRVSELFE